MKRILAKICRGIDLLTERTGRGVAWLNGVLILLICYDVAMRKFFRTTSIGMVEMEWHLYATIFLLGLPYALKHDKHVRVDVFYTRFSSRVQGWVDLLGTLFLLIPFCLVVIINGIDFASEAYAINESSPDPGGLPYRYLIKSVLAAAFVLLLLQTLPIMRDALKKIMGQPQSS